MLSAKVRRASPHLVHLVVLAAEGADRAHACYVLFDDVREVGQVLLHAGGAGEVRKKRALIQVMTGYATSPEARAAVNREQDHEGTNRDQEEGAVDRDETTRLDLMQVCAARDINWPVDVRSW